MGEIDFSQKFPAMRPVTKAPTLWTINGIGTTLYGKRDLDKETRAYVATMCLALVFVPILMLRAYRVIPSPNGGWYFLGTEPLSKLARAWNITVLVAALSAGVAIPLGAYWASPEYQEKRQFAEARQSAAAGNIAKAARAYETLALNGGVTSADAARELRAMADMPFTGSSASQAAGVFESLSRLAQHTGEPQAASLAAQGMKVAAAISDADPKESLALLRQVRRLVVDPRDVDAARLPILLKWVDKSPNEAEPAIQLAELLDAQGNSADARKLLEPFKANLGNGEGARILGSVYMHEGDYRGAYELLKPYVKPRLASFHDAERAYVETSQQLFQKELDLLRNDKGPRDLYRRLETATKDEQSAMVREYIDSRVMNNVHLRNALENLEKESAIVPVALELGIVMLDRAQHIADPAQRKAELEETQNVFLAIQGAAGESDEYRVFLGQVKYWLGKQDEGKALFDEFLLSKGRSARALIQVALTYRRLGSDSETRRLAEEAYNKASENEERFGAAQARSLVATDLEDRITWLQRQNVNEPDVKADVAMARGQQAFEKGQDAEAARNYQEAISIYNAMPKGVMVYNEIGLASYSLFLATGDPKDLEKCVDSIQQAVALSPSDPILLFNAGAVTMDASLSDIMSKHVSLQSIRRGGDLRLIRYLYRDHATREAVVKSVMEHPGVIKALSYIDKAMVVAPKSSRTYETAYQLQSFGHNTAAMRVLRQRLETADIDTSDNLLDLANYLSGKNDERNVTIAMSRLQRLRETAENLKAAGGLPYAIMLCSEVEALITLDVLGKPAASVDEILALAEASVKIADTAATQSARTASYQLRALHALRKADPRVEQLYARMRKILGPTHILALALSNADIARNAATQPDIQALLKQTQHELELFPQHQQTVDWAFTRHLDPPTAQRIAAIIRGDESAAIDCEISPIIYPTAVSEALDASWYYELMGNPGKAREMIKKMEGLGVPSLAAP